MGLGGGSETLSSVLSCLPFSSRMTSKSKCLLTVPVEEHGLGWTKSWESST